MHRDGPRSRSPRLAALLVLTAAAGGCYRHAVSEQHLGSGGPVHEPNRRPDMIDAIEDAVEPDEGSAWKRR